MNAQNVKAAEAWTLAWSQAPRSPRLPAAWKRLLSAILGELKAVLWSWE